MPTYQYACTECGHAFEQVQSFSDDALTVCPVCDGRLRKLFNAVGVVFTVANIELDFVRPARLDDELVVAVTVEQVRGASLTFGQVLFRKGKESLPLARARVRVGCVSYETFRPCPLPAGFKDKLHTIEGGERA